MLSTKKIKANAYKGQLKPCPTEPGDKLLLPTELVNTTKNKLNQEKYYHESDGHRERGLQELPWNTDTENTSDAYPSFVNLIFPLETWALWWKSPFALLCQADTARAQLHQQQDSALKIAESRAGSALPVHSGTGTAGTAPACRQYPPLNYFCHLQCPRSIMKPSASARLLYQWGREKLDYSGKNV